MLCTSKFNSNANLLSKTARPASTPPCYCLRVSLNHELQARMTEVSGCTPVPQKEYCMWEMHRNEMSTKCIDFTMANVQKIDIRQILGKELPIGLKSFKESLLKNSQPHPTYYESPTQHNQCHRPSISCLLSAQCCILSSSFLSSVVTCGLQL